MSRTGERILIVNRIRNLFTTEYRGIDIALLLTPFPVIGYFVTFLYELGRFNFYGLDASYIDLNINVLAMVCTSFFVFGLIVTFIYFVLKNSQWKSELTKQIVRLLAILIFFVLFIVNGIGFVKGMLMENAEPESSTVVWFAISMLAIAFLYDPKQFLRMKPIIITIAVLAALLLPLYYGYYSASSSTDNLILTTPEGEDYVQITKYKDSLILSPVDLETNKISSEYIFVELKSDISKVDDTLVLRKMNTGRLVVEDQK